MSDWEYKAHASWPGYGYIEPIADADCELIPEWLGNIIVNEVNQLRSRVAELEAVLRQVRAEYSGTPYAQWNSTMHRVDAAMEGK